MKEANKNSTPSTRPLSLTVFHKDLFD